MFWSKIAVTVPEKPLVFQGQTSEKTLHQIFQSKVPQFVEGATFTVNPSLWNGHTQTWYTALRKFEDRDIVSYGRRLINIDPDNRGYEVDGENLLYDKFKGKSTITLDYVKAEPEPATETENPVPISQQKSKLPPHTSYISEQQEKDILSSEKPLLVALHGLSGGSHESYLRALISEITEKHGFDALVVNSRGCAGHTPTTPQLFNGLWTNDIRYVVNEYLPQIAPHKKIYMIGFSLGGAILGNFLGQEGDQVNANIRGACIVAAPWDFVGGSIELESSFLGYRVYSPTMSKSLQNLAALHKENLVGNAMIKPDLTGEKLWLLREFDDAFTSKMFGFNSSSDYYRHASPAQRLRNVRVPTLVLSSLDDPIVGAKCLPHNEVKINPYITMVTTTCGGHLGWFNWKGQRWYPEPIATMFKELHQNWTWTKTSFGLPKSEDNHWKHDRIIQ